MDVNGQLHTPAALPTGRNPRYLLSVRLVGPQNWSVRYGVEKDLLTLSGIEHRPSLYRQCNLGFYFIML
jgi:hypothetical protein